MTILGRIVILTDRVRYPLRLYLFTSSNADNYYNITGSSNSSNKRYPSSRVQTRPKPSDFSGEKILSIPSFGGEV
jgi:hypothetical protein